MTLQTRLTLFSLATLVTATVLMVLLGTLVITDTVYESNRKLMALKLADVNSQIEKQYTVLKTHKLLDVGAYVEAAQAELAEWFKDYRFGETGGLHIIHSDGSPLSLFPVKPAFSKTLYDIAEFSKTKETQGAEFYRGDERFWAYESFPEWNWLIAVSISNAEILKKRTEYFQEVSLIGIAVLAVTLFIGYRLSRSITKRIKGTLACVNRVEAGDFECRITGPALSDELGTLQRGINAMISTLQRRTAEQQKTQSELRASEQKYRSLMENIGIGVAMISPGMEILALNRQMKEWFGDVEDSKRPLCYEAFNKPPRIDICPYCPTCETLKDGLVHESITDTPAGDKILHYRVVSSPITNEEGKVIAAIEMVEDITAIKQARDEKKKLQAQLQQAYKMEAIGTLAGGIAHDFNNILTPILVQTELAKLTVSDDHPVHENLDEVLIAGHRAKNLVNQILTFSRQTEQQRVSMDLGPVVKESLKLLRSSLPKTIEIIEDVKREPCTVEADPTQMQQVVLNLCTNAAQAMKKGGRLAVGLEPVELDADDCKVIPKIAPGGFVMLRISDTGSGIERNVIGRIFDPFFTTKPPGEGTGMGLAVVHGIVESHGGAVTVDSEPGKGATFRVFLPRIPQKKARETGDRVQVLPAGKERILFVDDEKSIVMLSRQMLERLGYQVETMTSPAEALAAFQRHPDKYDLVITDMTMPDMTGEFLAGELLRLRPDIPIILCTGFSYQMDQEKALGMGIRAFIMKPFVMKEIAETIRTVLDTSGGA